MPRFSANLSFLFGEVPFLQRFGEAAHAGFHAVEFAFAYDFLLQEIVAEQRAHRLDVVLINAPPGDWDAGDRGLASLPGREHEFSASMAQALQYAKALACTNVHVMAGIVPDGIDAAERTRRRRTYVRNLKQAAMDAAAQGVTILIEPINPRDMPGYLLTSQAEAHAIRTEVGARNLKVQMDCYHAQIVEGDLTEKLRRYLPHIGHVQIAGVPGRHEPDVGEVNYAWIFKVLDEAKYEGYVGCEYRPAKDTLAGLGWLYRLLDRPPRPGMS
ncbi:MAG TPA: 2-oxo-tetronate isomerase [Casimicrobiaceae bacterium]|jgi:hydroxypyruvate isomerase